MKILKIEEEEYKCPNCKLPLEFDCNELKNIPFWKAFFMIDNTTGNAWFRCNKCKKNYLIENYAKKN